MVFVQHYLCHSVRVDGLALRRVGHINAAKVLRLGCYSRVRQCLPLSIKLGRFTYKNPNVELVQKALLGSTQQPRRADMSKFIQPAVICQQLRHRSPTLITKSTLPRRTTSAPLLAASHFSQSAAKMSPISVPVHEDNRFAPSSKSATAYKRFNLPETVTPGILHLPSSDGAQAKKALETLLAQDRESHHCFFNPAGFHNHLSHQ